MNYPDWLKAGLKKRGKSQAGLSRATGIHASVISRIASGTRPLRVGEAEKIAAYLEEPLPQASVGRGVGISMAPIRDIASEATWREKSVPPKLRLHQIPIVPDGLYPANVQYGVQLGSDDTESGVDAEFAVCIPMRDMQRPLRHGDRVHVTQTAGSLVQVLVRRVAVDSGGKFQLLPLEPRDGLAPIPLNKVEAEGFVIGRYTRYLT